MSTRAYVRFVADHGDFSETAAVYVHSDGWPAHLFDEIAALQQLDELERPIGYAGTLAFGGETGSVSQLEDYILDGDAPVEFCASWSYEVIIEAPYLTEWQVRVSTYEPPADPDDWAVDAPLGVVYDDLVDVSTPNGLHVLAAELEGRP